MPGAAAVGRQTVFRPTPVRLKSQLNHAQIVLLSVSTNLFAYLWPSSTNTSLGQFKHTGTTIAVMRLPWPRRHRPPRCSSLLRHSKPPTWYGHLDAGWLSACLEVFACTNAVPTTMPITDLLRLSHSLVCILSAPSVYPSHNASCLSQVKAEPLFSSLTERVTIRFHEWKWPLAQWARNHLFSKQTNYQSGALVSCSIYPLSLPLSKRSRQS